MNLLADWGAAGGLIVLAGMAAFAAGLWETRKHVQRAERDLGRRSGTSNRFAFFLGASAGLLALAVHSVFDFNLHIPANAILGVTLLALLTSNLRFATERYWLNARLPVRMLATVALAGGVAYLGWQGWRRGAENSWLARAQSPALLVLDRAALLEKAFAAEPENFETAYNIGEAYRMQSFVGGAGLCGAGGNGHALVCARPAARTRSTATMICAPACASTGWTATPRPARFTAAPSRSIPTAISPSPTSAGITSRRAITSPPANGWSVRCGSNGTRNVIGHSYLDWVEQKLAENASGKGLLPAGF